MNGAANSKILVGALWFMLVPTAFVLPSFWSILNGNNKDYDVGGMITLFSILFLVSSGLIAGAIHFRKKERVERAKLAESYVFAASPPNGTNAFAWVDFKTRFPHMFWVSTVTYDRDDPNGFHYKLLATRLEPEKLVEFVLLRQSEESGLKSKVFHVQGPLDSLDKAEELLQRIQKDSNVEFECFDFSQVRQYEEFKDASMRLGWDCGVIE